MVPLHHPTLESITVEGILHALADPVRVAIFAKIASAKCAQSCSMLAGVGVDDKPIPKSTLSQHFKALRLAGLILAERHGTEMRNTARCEELETRFPGLVPAIVAAHALQSERARAAAAAARRKASAKRVASSR